MESKFTFQYGATSTQIEKDYQAIFHTFTFQYGATSTNGFFAKAVVEKEFTFQYGATSTRSYLMLNFSIVYETILSTYKNL